MPRAFLLVLAIYYGHCSGLAIKDLMDLMEPDVKRDMLPRFIDISAILLAGGASTRMGGRNKAFLKIGAKTIIQREIDALEPIFDRIIIITNNFDTYSCLGKPMFADIKPGHGSLGGIFTGLNCCSTEYGFIFACDMPFLNQEVISYICKRSWGHDITIPRIGGYLEPLHAVYSARCIPFIEKLMQRGNLKIKKLFNEVDMLEIEQQELATIDPCLQFHINVNTPTDLDKAMEMVRTNSQLS